MPKSPKGEKRPGQPSLGRAHSIRTGTCLSATSQRHSRTEMRTLLRWLLVMWGGLWAAILVAATVPAPTAMSNLETWGELFGLQGVVTTISSPGYDLVPILISVTNLSLTIFLWVYAVPREPGERPWAFPVAVVKMVLSFILLARRF
jgi:hypothetical protein